MNLTTALTILQQSEYLMPQWRRWYADHLHDDPAMNLEPKTWTPKLRLIKYICQLLFFLPMPLRLAVATNLTWPAEFVIRQRTYGRARAKLAKLRQNGLVVASLAGSYGKTSTKTIMGHLLAGEKNILITPKSINTILGIAQVILKDLQPTHQLFIVEMGEFQRGDLAKLCDFVNPEFGVLTPIGHQHEEILGSWENLLAEMRDYVQHFAPSKLIVAHENVPYAAEIGLAQDTPIYGSNTQCHYQTMNTHVSRAGTEYQVVLPDQGSVPNTAKSVPMNVFIPLYGAHQALNTLPSFWLGSQLGVPLAALAARGASLPFIPHRHEPHFAESNVLILDNSYNTNPQSILASLTLMDDLQPTRKIMITLGFVEQGAAAAVRHHELGQLLARRVDYVGLIHSPYTQDILSGFTAAGGSLNHIKVGKTQEEALAAVQSFIIAGSVVVFDGGFQEMYG